MTHSRKGARLPLSRAAATFKQRGVRLLPYSVALLSVVLALGTTLLFSAWMSATPTPLFFLAVIVSAWYGGLGPGLLVALLSTLAVNFFLIEPQDFLYVTNPRTVLQLIIFAVAALLVNQLNQSRRMALRQAQADLNERKRTEAALQESTAILNTINQTSPTLIFVKDRQGRILMANPATLEAIGQPAAAVMGRTDAEFQVNQEEAERIMSNDRQVMQMGQVQVFEEILEVAAGRRTFLSTKSSYRDSQGNIIGLIGVAFDVTERKLAEAALQASEVRFRQMAETIEDVFWLLDPQSQQILYVSPAYEKVWGRSHKTLCNDINQWLETIHPDDRKLVQAAVSQCISNGSHEIEYRVVHPDGSIRWVRDRGFLIRDEQGRPDRITGVAQDVTERKQVETALRESDRRFKSVFNQQFQYMAILTTEGRVVDINEIPLVMAGVKREDVLGELFWETPWWTPLPDAKAMWTAHIAQVMQGESVVSEGFYAARDGTLRYAQYALTAVRDEAGRVVNLIVQAGDLTDRKQAEAALLQSEERYRYLVELIPQLVWSANAAGVLLDVNQRWLDFTGLTLAQAQLEGWQAFVHPDDIPTLSQQWVAAQHNGVAYQAEGRIRRADGAYRWYLHQALPLKNEQGQVIKWFGTATDIEDQKQLERQRDRLFQQEQTAREAAEQANRIKDEFLAVLSHELRSPLNPILGWAKLLQAQKLDETKTKQALQTIERNAKLQTQLVEDLLDISRILRGKLVLTTGSVNLANVITAALETVRLSAEVKQIEIQSILMPAVGRVSGDASRLQQIVWNLLSNAIKFTPAGGRVEIKLERIELGSESTEAWQNQAIHYGKSNPSSPPPLSLPHSSYAQITVTDTGKGINPDFLPYVFDYFRQEDSKTTRKFGGLGLGLGIVRQLTELHGGTVHVESTGEGLGATFTIRLPLMPDEDRRIKEKDGADSVPPLFSLPLTGSRILVVDDDEDMRNVMITILEQSGATVRTAASAAEALVALDLFQPNLLISDIGMPDVDGYMLMQQIRNRSPQQGGQILAIALTAYAGELDQHRALQAGFQRHLAKPIEPNELVKTITALLRETLDC